MLRGNTECLPCVGTALPLPQGRVFTLPPELPLNSVPLRGWVVIDTCYIWSSEQNVECVVPFKEIFVSILTVDTKPDEDSSCTQLAHLEAELIAGEFPTSLTVIKYKPPRPHTGPRER